MHRIDTPGNVANRWTTSNPQVGQRATLMGADWPNAVQEELCTVIEQAGIALDKAAHDQLYLAIVALVAGVVGTGGANVPATRQVNGGGLVTGGGTLANNLTLTVTKCSGAEIAAGTVDTKAITPAGLVAAMASSKGTTGYTRLFDGFILMWGTATAAGNSTTVVTLPTTFPTLCAFAAVEGGNAVNDAQDNNPTVTGRGTGSISIYSAQNGSLAVNWFAIGF